MSFIKVDVSGLSALHSEKGRANMFRTLSSFEKYRTNIDDMGGKKRYSWNILQWCKNDFKSKNNTNGDYLFFLPIMHTVKGFLV